MDVLPPVDGQSPADEFDRPAVTRALHEIVSQVLRAPDEAVLELGVGTAVIARALLASGLSPDRLLVVEIEPAMAAHLRQVLPGVNVIEGDARDLPDLLPAEWRGRIGTAMCGIPLVPLPSQRHFIDAMEAVAPGRGFLHYSYCATSPLPWRRSMRAADCFCGAANGRVALPPVPAA